MPTKNEKRCNRNKLETADDRLDPFLQQTEDTLARSSRHNNLQRGLRVSRANNSHSLYHHESHRQPRREFPQGLRAAAALLLDWRREAGRNIIIIAQQQQQPLLVCLGGLAMFCGPPVLSYAVDSHGDDCSSLRGWSTGNGSHLFSSCTYPPIIMKINRLMRKQEEQQSIAQADLAGVWTNVLHDLEQKDACLLYRKDLVKDDYWPVLQPQFNVTLMHFCYKVCTAQRARTPRSLSDHVRSKPPANIWDSTTREKTVNALWGAAVVQAHGDSPPFWRKSRTLSTLSADGKDTSRPSRLSPTIWFGTILLPPPAGRRACSGASLDRFVGDRKQHRRTV